MMLGNRLMAGTIICIAARGDKVTYFIRMYDGTIKTIEVKNESKSNK